MVIWVFFHSTRPDQTRHCVIQQTHQNEGKYSPNEVSDDEELHDAVDDADGPALHYH